MDGARAAARMPTQVNSRTAAAELTWGHVVLGQHRLERCCRRAAAGPESLRAGRRGHGGCLLHSATPDGIRQRAAEPRRHSWQRMPRGLLLLYRLRRCCSCSCCHKRCISHARRHRWGRCGAPRMCHNPQLRRQACAGAKAG